MDLVMNFGLLFCLHFDGETIAILILIPIIKAKRAAYTYPYLEREYQKNKLQKKR